MKFVMFWIVAVLLSIPASTGMADAVYDANYARDRAEIEDLQARYLFALDFFDAATYAATFTEDGVLDWAGGVVQGRDAIRSESEAMGKAFRAQSGANQDHPPRLRHFISTMVIKVEGDRAVARAYWHEFNNDGRSRWPYVGGYGHYEDELRRVDGHWLFSKRKIYNEQLSDRLASEHNPAW